ncbi:hypothetical protein OIO90_000611 [Microbotryomycetes sp. JL221]|nr:hypothetical protein OIO90_000611 [Microbotryomycetes sp. JL221]
MYGGGYGPPPGWQQSPPGRGGYGPPGPAYGAPPPPRAAAPGYGYGGGGGGGPRHAGLGSQGAAPNLPPPPNLHQSPQPPSADALSASHFPSVPTSSGWNGEKFSLFVGNIADGVSDQWLERIVGTAGPVLNLKRPTPAFGFVEYSDPESVLRALEAVNGVKLSGKNGQDKALLIKADDKVKARLQEYETTRVKDDSTTEYLEQTKNDLKQIVDRLNSGNDAIASANAAKGDSQIDVPDRLKDLDESELPEEQRGVITSEIAMFRVRSSKKRGEVEQEAALKPLPKTNSSSSTQPLPPTGPAAMRSEATPSSSSSAATPSRTWGGSADPQSFNKPVGFVAQGTQLDDEDKERERLERVRKDAEIAYKDRERRLEAHERTRLKNVERQQERDLQNDEREARDRQEMQRRLESYDDDAEADKGRELFYEDRHRWRAQRRQLRQREKEADDRDRKREQEQLAAASKASDDFLNADIFSGMSGKGGLKLNNGDEPVVKLSFGAVAKPAAKPTAPARATVFMSGDDDDDEGKSKRALVPLDYSDDEEDLKEQTSRMSRSERDKKAREIIARVPDSKDLLWAYKVRWNNVDENLISRHLAPFAKQLIIESLGFEEDELLNAVTSHVRAHKSPNDLVQELEPVLDEEATDFVVKIWSKLIQQTELSRHGL